MASTTSAFGALLRSWRSSKGLSQIDLAAVASSTSRHISYLETGKSRPSQNMVLRLCEVLSVPLRQRNQLLVAAGLAPHYSEEQFGADRYDAARVVIHRLLAGHEPYPALVLDRQGGVVASNSGAERLFGMDLTNRNVMDIPMVLNAEKHVVNWPDVATAMLARSRAELLVSPLDETLQAAVLSLSQVVDALPERSRGTDVVSICPQFRVGNRVIDTMVIAARFDNAVDVTINELRIELIYPLGDEAEAFFAG